MDDDLLQRLKNSRLHIVLVIHANHPAEIDAHTARVLQRCRESGMFLLNQTVLLKGINDHVDVLTQLSHRLFNAGVMPYYLHVMDRVQGAAHFDLEAARAIEIHEELMVQLAGYLVPKLVREVAGAPHKVPVDRAIEQRMAKPPTHKMGTA
jgi:KamA family protein